MKVGVSRNLWRTTQSGLTAPERMNFPIQGLVLYLPLWHPELSGSTITSKDLNAHSCTVVGAVHTPPTYRLFDGADDYITIPSSSGDWTQSTEQTVIVWVKPRVIGGNMQLITKRESADWSWHHRIEADGTLKAQFVAETGSDVSLDVSTTTLVGGTWYMYTCTYSVSADYFAIYLNDAAEEGNTTADATTIELSSDDVAIGLNLDGLTNDLDGVIGEVAFYDRALSTMEISSYYNMTRWRYQ